MGRLQVHVQQVIGYISASVVRVGGGGGRGWRRIGRTTSRCNRKRHFKLSAHVRVGCWFFCRRIKVVITVAVAVLQLTAHIVANTIAHNTSARHFDGRTSRRTRVSICTDAGEIYR